MTNNDGWGKPWTPEELAKSPTGRQASSEPNMQNIPGTPAHALEWAIERGMKLAPAKPAPVGGHNSLPQWGAPKPQTELTRALETIMTPGFPDGAVPRYSQMMGRATRDVPPGPAVVKDWSLATRKRGENELYPHQIAMVEAINNMTDEDISAWRGGLWSNDDPPRVEYVEGPDAWPVNPADAGEPEPLTPEHYDHPECVVSPVETIAEGDGPFYVVYFGRVNYSVLAGPYDSEAEAQAATPAAWERFKVDTAFDFIFPHRDEAGLQVTTVRSVHNLKGAYGKV